MGAWRDGGANGCLSTRGTRRRKFHPDPQVNWGLRGLRMPLSRPGRLWPTIGSSGRSRDPLWRRSPIPAKVELPPGPELKPKVPVQPLRRRILAKTECAHHRGPIMAPSHHHQSPNLAPSWAIHGPYVGHAVGMLVPTWSPCGPLRGSYLAPSGSPRPPTGCPVGPTGVRDGCPSCGVLGATTPPTGGPRAYLWGTA